MQKSHLASVIAVAALAFGAGAFAEDAASWIGAAPSHRSFERFDMSIGVTAGQLPRRPARVEEDRNVLNVPSHYGSLVGVTGDSHATVFWYRSDDGAMRNAVLIEPAHSLYKVQQVPATRFEVDNREQ